MKTKYDSYTVEEHNVHAIVDRIRLRKKESPEDYLYWVNEQGHVHRGELKNIQAAVHDTGKVAILFGFEPIIYIESGSLFWRNELAVAHLELGGRK